MSSVYASYATWYYVSMRFLRSLAILLTSSTYFLASIPVHATGEFTTAFTSTYVVGDSTTTHVSHDISITNNLAHIYTTSYTLSVGSDKVTNIKASDEKGTLSSAVDKNGAATTITINIPDPAMGQGKTKHLQVSYDTPDIAEVIGNTATVNIPRLYRGNEIAAYSRVIIVPHSFPPLTIVSPQPSSTSELQDGTMSYTFVGHPEDSISLLFGSSVTYQLSLAYDIQNPTYSAGDTEIALPPDTPYQHIAIASLDPAPTTIRVDADGNWLAIYPLGSRVTEKVHATLFATVYPNPEGVDPGMVTSTLTAPQKYWETGDSSVQSLARALVSPENIYNYLVDNFRYNYHRVAVGATRLGAAGALASPTDAICTEFTDTFVALSRAGGIPAREIDGYAYSKNDTLHPLSVETDVLHAWPEYYDAGNAVWQEVDPTWGNTTGGIDYFHKLDFSHIAFVRHGIESAYPYPAGAYKGTADEKQVQVTVVASMPSEDSSYRVLPGGVIRNTGTVAMVNRQVKVGDTTVTVPYLPPYGEFTPPVAKTSQWSLASIVFAIRDFLKKLLP